MSKRMLTALASLLAIFALTAGAAGVASGAPSSDAGAEAVVAVLYEGTDRDGASQILNQDKITRDCTQEVTLANGAQSVDNLTQKDVLFSTTKENCDGGIGTRVNATQSEDNLGGQMKWVKDVTA